MINYFVFADGQHTLKADFQSLRAHKANKNSAPAHKRPLTGDWSLISKIGSLIVALRQSGTSYETAKVCRVTTRHPVYKVVLLYSEPLCFFVYLS